MGWERKDRSVGMGAWEQKCGDGSVRTGVCRWEHGDGSMGTGAWGREHDDGIMRTGAWVWEHGDGSHFFSGNLFSKNLFVDQMN